MEQTRKHGRDRDHRERGECVAGGGRWAGGWFARAHPVEERTTGGRS